MLKAIERGHGYLMNPLCQRRQCAQVPLCHGPLGRHRYTQKPDHCQPMQGRQILNSLSNTLTTLRLSKRMITPENRMRSEKPVSAFSKIAID